MKYNPHEVADLVCGICKKPHCVWCGRRVRFGEAKDRRDATREHMTPVSLGGSNATWNKELACRQCNEARGTSMDWVPFHTHNGATDLMSPEQAVSSGFSKVGTTGISMQDLPPLEVGDFVDKDTKPKVRTKEKPCSECGATVTGVYPGRKCYGCWLRMKHNNNNNKGGANG